MYDAWRLWRWIRELVGGKNTLGWTAVVMKKPHKSTFNLLNQKYILCDVICHLRRDMFRFYSSIDRCHWTVLIVSHTYIHKNIHTYTHIYLHKHIHTYTHIYTYLNTHTYICTYIHTFKRGGADKSLVRTTSQCRRTESIVSLERRVCSCAELQDFSCYRGWKEAWQATRAI